VTTSSDVGFDSADGWPIRALLRVPDAAHRAGGSPGLVAVPGSRHERDAWSQVAAALATSGASVLQIDIRGRGASTNGTPWATMGPAQRRRVALDVAAAVDHLAGVEGVDSSRLGLLVEHDTAALALEAVAGDPRIAALAVLSARDPERTRAAVEQRRAPVYGLVSVEDRDGLRATVDAYLAAPRERSRLDVFHGVGVGITMASVLQFERPDQLQLDARLSTWFAEVFKVGGTDIQPHPPSIATVARPRRGSFEKRRRGR
jgi:dienelactone hydrolase